MGQQRRQPLDPLRLSGVRPSATWPGQLAALPSTNGSIVFRAQNRRDVWAPPIAAPSKSRGEPNDRGETRPNTITLMSQFESRSAHSTSHNRSSQLYSRSPVSYSSATSRQVEPLGQLAAELAAASGLPIGWSPDIMEATPGTIILINRNLYGKVSALLTSLDSSSLQLSRKYKGGEETAVPLSDDFS